MTTGSAGIDGTGGKAKNKGMATEWAFSRPLELIAGAAPVTDALQAIAQAVEQSSDGLSVSVALAEKRDKPFGTITTKTPRSRPLSASERGLVGWAQKLAALAIEHTRLRDAEAGYRAVLERLPAVVYIADPGVTGRWHYVSPQIESLLGFTSDEFLSNPALWAEQLHPDDRDFVIAAEADAESGAGSEYTTASEYRMVRADGEFVWIRDDALLARDSQGILRWHGVLSDITLRKQAEAEVERRAAQQAAVARLGEHALEGADLGGMMKEAVAEAVRIMNTDLGAVLELMPDGESLLLRAGLGWGVAGESRVPTGRQSQSGFTLEIGRPVVVTDWNHEQRFEKPAALRGKNMRSGLTVVIEGPERPFGVLGVNSIQPREFSVADVNFVQALANVLADAIQRQATEDDIRHRALHDSLTLLPNRVLFLDRLEHALARLRRQKSQVAALFLGIDHFKLVNDSLGHQAGDDLLRAVASTLEQVVRPGDTVARFGGDEFGILLEQIASELDAIEVAQRIAAAFARPFALRDTEHFVSASVGIALADSSDQLAEGVIRDADAAMYRAKERGRGRYELFDEDMRARAGARLRVENDLRHAVERRELRLEYQPIVSLRDGSISGVEALVRWQHPTRGLVPPAEFIPVAESCGLIEPIGRWVLGEACRQAAQWHMAHPDNAPLGISVNLSACQVAQEDLPATVAQVIRSTGIDATSISLEITETVLLEEAEVLGDTLRGLRSLGVGLVLDDFGTGYSSLGYLNRLPLDALKVDRSFIDGLGTEPGDSAIVKAIVGMAQAMSLAVIAEGVESEVPLVELRRLGCGQAQGYFFARPLPAGQITDLLDTRAPFRELVKAPV
jgi:diguanylate cyclase (GGDEF)-like protein/PAS domain S-box-containing protein